MVNTITNYFKGVWSEMKKVSWPTRATVLNHTIIVIASIVIAIGLTAAIDAGLTKLVQLIVQSKN
ncbi:MAG: preprotein translocase subunit SecE [Patescibacteria group bacterium]